MRRLASVLLLLLTFSEVASAGPVSPGDDVAFEVVLSESFGSGLDRPTDFLIHTERHWCSLWRKVYSYLVDPPPCDRSAVDFGHELVIASTLGARVNGCYGVAISEIKRIRGRAIRVVVNEQVPGRSCLCSQAFVHPVEAVVVSRPVGGIEFVHEQTFLDCSR